MFIVKPKQEEEVKRKQANKKFLNDILTGIAMYGIIKAVAATVNK